MMKHPPSSFRIHIPAVIPFLQTACGNLGSLSAPWEAERGVCVCVSIVRRARAPGSSGHENLLFYVSDRALMLTGE